MFACLCETDYCNSYRSPDEPVVDPSVLGQKPRQLASNINKPLLQQPDVTGIQNSVKINSPDVKTSAKQQINKVGTLSRTTTVSPTILTTTSRNTELRCHKCGDLFNPDDQCDTWNATGSGHVETCQPGEACLLYMWYKSDAVSATVRHCFSKQILLGKSSMFFRRESDSTITNVCPSVSLSISQQVVLISTYSNQYSL